MSEIMYCYFRKRDSAELTPLPHPGRHITRFVLLYHYLGKILTPPSQLRPTVPEIIFKSLLWPYADHCLLRSIFLPLSRALTSITYFLLSSAFDIVFLSQHIDALLLCLVGWVIIRATHTPSTACPHIVAKIRSFSQKLVKRQAAKESESHARYLPFSGIR